jgi:hypothetical protein
MSVLDIWKWSANEPGMKKSLKTLDVDRIAFRTLSNREIAHVVGGADLEATVGPSQLSKLPGRWKTPDPT